MNVKVPARISTGAVLFAALTVVSGVLPGRPLPASPAPQAASQEVQKPKYDYMSNFRSRNTRPLGLKENASLKKMLDQGAVKWAIRAGSRQVLD